MRMGEALWYYACHMKDILKWSVIGGLFLIPLLPVYVENHFFFPYITGKNFAFRIIVELVFAAWILLACYEKQYRPKFSWIVGGFLALLGVMAVADALGVYPLQSFWSNFERMDGYVTLLHIFMMMLVMGSVFTTQKLWNVFLHVCVAVATLVALYGLAQYNGLVSGTRVRVDSQLGNAAYMAIYMLFNIFILFWLAVQNKYLSYRLIYIAVAGVLGYTLLLTGTRGTFLGLVGGTAVTLAYISFFGRKYPELRKVAIGAFIVVAIAGIGFYAVRDTQFVQNQPALARIANISLGSDLVVREAIWKMAIAGIKERPILGWGQSNFNFVFNKYYDPSIYYAESWYDRTHDIFFDWLITGGILGLIAYFSIFFAALYYLFWQPIFSKEEPVFNVLERGVLIGLLVGYLIHNLVVFDNIISYIFYGTILALVHSRVARPIARIEAPVFDTELISQFMAPIVILITIAVVYFVNVPGIQASGDIIKAMTAPTVAERLQSFTDALNRHSFADQEIIEQLTQQAMSIAANDKISEQQKLPIEQKAEQELIRINNEKQGDARLHSFFSSFYRSIGNYQKAQEQAEIAHELSPKKQAIITEQAIIELQLGNEDKALAYFKNAFELDEANTQARVLYAADLAGNGKTDEAKALIGDQYLKDFASNDFALSMVDKGGDKQFLALLLQSRIAAEPDNPQNRASLAYVYYQLGEKQEAIDALNQAGKDIPTFTKTAECFIANIQKGKDPADGCQ